MTSNARGASTESNNSTDEEPAIATDALKQSEQQNQASRSSETTTSTSLDTASPEKEAAEQQAPSEQESQSVETESQETAAAQTASTETEAAAVTASNSYSTSLQASAQNGRDSQAASSSPSQTESKETESSSQSNFTTSSSNSSNESTAAPANEVSGESESTAAQTSETGSQTAPLTANSQTTSETGSSNSNAVTEDSSGDEATTGEETLPDKNPLDKDDQGLAPLLPKNDLANIKQLPSAEFDLSGSLAQDEADLYQFTVEETGVFTATLSNLSADADVQLIQDKNANGQVDAGEIVAWEWEQGSKDESIRHFLQSGDYVLRVLDQDIDSEPTDYSIATTFQAAETDDRAFSINVIYQTGVEGLNESAIAAIERAADYWENVISYSSFDRPLELALGIYGTTNTEMPFLAYAGPYRYRSIGETSDASENESSEDRLLPTVGVTVLNNIYLEQYNDNPDYLESVVRHEIAHVLGLGIIWDNRGNDFVDQDTGTYRADSYAGQSYGELLGTYQETAIPLDADYRHWSEETFDTELFTPNAEGIGSSLPLSQLTISALRDLGWNVNYGAAEAFNLPNNSAIA